MWGLGSTPDEHADSQSDGNVGDGALPEKRQAAMIQRAQSAQTGGRTRDIARRLKQMPGTNTYSHRGLRRRCHRTGASLLEGTGRGCERFLHFSRAQLRGGHTRVFLETYRRVGRGKGFS